LRRVVRRAGVTGQSVGRSHGETLRVLVV